MSQTQQLTEALFWGRQREISAILAEDPEILREDFGLQCALYDVEAVEAALNADPGLATKVCGRRRPILHVAFSQYLHGAGDQGDMIKVARALLDAGADPCLLDATHRSALSHAAGAGHARVDFSDCDSAPHGPSAFLSSALSSASPTDAGTAASALVRTCSGAAGRAG